MLHTEEDQRALHDILDEHTEWFADMTVGACLRSKMIVVRKEVCRQIVTSAYTREQIAEQIRIALITSKYDKPWLGGCIRALEATA